MVIGVPLTPGETVPQQLGDLLLTLHHGKESRLLHQKVLLGGGTDLTQIPVVYR